MARGTQGNLQRDVPLERHVLCNGHAHGQPFDPPLHDGRPCRSRRRRSRVPSTRPTHANARGGSLERGTHTTGTDPRYMYVYVCEFPHGFSQFVKSSQYTHFLYDIFSTRFTVRSPHTLHRYTHCSCSHRLYCRICSRRPVLSSHRAGAT